MWDVDPGVKCPVCNSRRGMKVTIELTFEQVTDRGPVTCKVAVPKSVCTCCGFEMLDAEAEAVMDQAVDQQYRTLPPVRDGQGRFLPAEVSAVGFALDGIVWDWRD